MKSNNACYASFYHNVIKTLCIYVTCFLCFQFFGLSLIASTFHSNDDSNRYIIENQVNYKHFEAHLKIDPLENKVEGRIIFTLNRISSAIDSLVLYSPGFSFSRVLLDSNEVLYYIKNENIVIRLPNDNGSHQKHFLELYYEVKPEKELHFIGWNDTLSRMRKQIWAQRPYYWLPFVNDQLTSDLFVTFGSDFRVFANGFRKSVIDNPDGTSTWHYSIEQRRPFVSTVLAIGNYDLKAFKSKTGLLVELWFYPETESHADATYALIDEMISFCNEMPGKPYPIDIYRQVPVADYFFAQNMPISTVLCNDLIYPYPGSLFDENNLNPVVNQFFYHWFGSYYPHLKQKDIELLEGLAALYANLFKRDYFGEDFYQVERVRNFNKIIGDSFITDAHTADIKNKAERRKSRDAIVLEMLMDELGIDDFNKSVLYYLKEIASSADSTFDFQKAVFETTGKNTDWFFRQWFDGDGMPHYKISVEDYPDHLFMKIEQIQEVDGTKPYFKANLVFDAFYIDGSTERHSFLHDAKEQLAVIPKKTTMLFLLFDPGNRILKQTTYERSVYDLFDQFLNTELTIDRYRALVELRETPIEDKRSLYIAEAGKSTSNLVKEEILCQLSMDKNEDTMDLFSTSLKNNDPIVRHAALKCLDKQHKSILAEIVACLADTYYDNNILALQKLHKIDPENIEKYLTATNHVTGFRGRDVRIAWLKIAILSKQDYYIDELVEYASSRYEFQTRINAISALVESNILNQQAVSHMIDAALYWNPVLCSAALSALKVFSVNDAIFQMIEFESASKIADEDHRSKFLQNLR